MIVTEVAALLEQMKARETQLVDMILLDPNLPLEVDDTEPTTKTKQNKEVEGKNINQLQRKRLRAGF